MRKYDRVLSAMVFGLCIGVGYLFLTTPPQEERQSRRTSIVVGSDALKQIESKNITNTSGVVSIDVDTLESPVRFGTYSGLLRWNGGEIEYSNDNGSTYLAFDAYKVVDGNGAEIDSLAAQNFTSVSGTLTSQVSRIESPVRFGTYSGLLRWNAGAIEFSNDNGANWFQIGGGGGTQYGLSGNGTGILAQAALVNATTLQPKFFNASWNFATVVYKNSTGDIASFLFLENDTYSVTRLNIWMDHTIPKVTVGYAVYSSVPATATYICDGATILAAAQRAIDTAQPMAVEYNFDSGAQRLTCAVNGLSDYDDTASEVIDTRVIGSTDTVKLGSGLNGAMLFARMSDVALTQLSFSPLYKEGVNPMSVWLVDFNEKSGATVFDSISSASLWPIHLTVDDGAWTEYQDGY